MVGLPERELNYQDNRGLVVSGGFGSYENAIYISPSPRSAAYSSGNRSNTEIQM